jgi:hypothetical protein
MKSCQFYWLKREKALKDGRVPIYVRITVNGGRDGFASGKKIRPDAWDEKVAIAGMNCPEYQAINSYITKTKAELEKCYNVMEATCDRVTATMVKDAYKPKPVVDQQSLGAAFKLHNEEFAEKVAK